MSKRHNGTARRLAEVANVSQAGTSRVLKALARVVTESERLNVPGLGVFRRVTRKARTVRNPQTGEPQQLPASTTISFRAALALREQLRRGA